MAKRIDDFLMEQVLAHGREGRVLDIPCGRGDLSRRLAAAGYDVTPADLSPEALDWEGRQAVLADMNEPLPFDAKSFEVVVSQEGIEHLENLAGFFRECHRVLRPGGQLLVTTPNFMDLSSRLSFFLTGMKSFHAGFPNEEGTVWGRHERGVYHGHAFTLPYFQIRYLLRVAGFAEVSFQGLGRSGFSVLLYGLVRPLAGGLIGRAQRRLEGKARAGRRRAISSPELAERLRHEALSPQLLCRRKLCIRAVLP